MKDRLLAIIFLGLALLLFSAVVVGLLVGLIEWLQSGYWPSISLLEAAYDTGLVRARWFITVDWGWRLHEWLDAVPLSAAAIVFAPLFWWIGLVFARR
jgi:hypothetical protein